MLMGRAGLLFSLISCHRNALSEQVFRDRIDGNKHWLRRVSQIASFPVRMLNSTLSFARVSSFTISVLYVL